MVRAGSLNGGWLKNNLRLVSIVVAVLVVGSIASYFLFSTVFDNGDENIKTATSTTLPKTVQEEIANIGFPVSQPNQIPVNFVRTKVQVIPASSTKSKCQEVLQSYQGTENDDEAFIDVYSSAAGCAFPRPGDAEPYTVGDYSGWISEPTTPDEDGFLPSLLIELTVNQGIVRIESAFSSDLLKSTIEKFVPFSNIPPDSTLKVSL